MGLETSPNVLKFEEVLDIEGSLHFCSRENIACVCLRTFLRATSWIIWVNEIFGICFKIAPQGGGGIEIGRTVWARPGRQWAGGIAAAQWLWGGPRCHFVRDNKEPGPSIRVLIFSVLLTEGYKFLNHILTWDLPCCRTMFSCVRKTQNWTLKVSFCLLSLPLHALTLDKVLVHARGWEVTFLCPLLRKTSKVVFIAERIQYLKKSREMGSVISDESFLTGHHWFFFTSCHC